MIAKSTFHYMNDMFLKLEFLRNGLVAPENVKNILKIDAIGIQKKKQAKKVPSTVFPSFILFFFNFPLFS